MNSSERKKSAWENFVTHTKEIIVYEKVIDFPIKI